MQVAERTQNLGQVVNALQGAHCAITGTPALFRVLGVQGRAKVALESPAYLLYVTKTHGRMEPYIHCEASHAFIESNITSSPNCSAACHSVSSVSVSTLVPSLHAFEWNTGEACCLVQ